MKGLARPPLKMKEGHRNLLVFDHVCVKDMMIIFPMFEHYPEMPEEDVKVSRKVIRMLIDFSKSDGNDGNQWQIHHSIITHYSILFSWLL